MKKLDRRSFLTSSAVAGIALPGTIQAAMAASPRLLRAGTPLNLNPPPSGYASEADRITQATLTKFWDSGVGMYRAPVLSAEAVPSDAAHDRGYVFWPSQIGLHSLVEGAKSNPSKYAPQIWTVYSGLEKYFNSSLHAYTAWLNFPGNNDAYYDDNAWAVITLAEAYLATKTIDLTHANIYLNRAIDIMANYVYGGWDSTGNPGGMKWGTDTTKPGTSDKTVSATAGAALAALMLAKAGWNASFNISWGGSVLAWLWSHLKDTDNLILDGLKSPSWNIMTTKWTYNTGVPMRAYIEHYRLSNNATSLVNATTLANAALDHTKRMYDGLVNDTTKRCFYDGTYFVHFLLDGMLQVKQATTNTTLANALAAEGKREANYCYNYIRDNIDNYYWRNWRLWRIGSGQLAQWQGFTGQTTTLDTDPSEKSNDGTQWVKTLLANASASRLFWIASRF